MKILRSSLSRKWRLTTLLVCAALAVMIRLGIWQLDRLDQRREFNRAVSIQQSLPELVLDQSTLSLDLVAMEYRAVRVTGEYLPEEELALRNQADRGRLGYHLLTPLRVYGTETAVVVDRGWVPVDDYQPGDVGAYAVPGPVEVAGILRLGQTHPDFGGRQDPPGEVGERLLVWNLVNLERIAAQSTVELIPVYIQQAGPGLSLEDAPPPIPSLPELELTDGPHLGYAFQWFLFALVLGAGYPFFLQRENEGNELSD